MVDFGLSIIKLINNEILTINDSIDFLIENNDNFKNEVQLILIDIGSSDGSYEIAQDYKNQYPNNIILLQSAEHSQGKGIYYNLALKYVKGNWIHFWDDNGELSSNVFRSAFKHIDKYANEVDIISTPVKFYNNKTKSYDFKIDYSKNDIIDLNKLFNHSSIHIGASFIKKDAIDNKFSEVLIDCEESLFLTEILLKKDKYALIKDAYFKTTNEKKYPQDFYTESYVDNKLDLFFNNLISKTQNNVSKYLQYILSNNLTSIIRIADLNTVYDDENKIKKFWNKLNEILNVLDLNELEVHEEIPRIVRSFLVYLKNNDFHIEVNNELNKVFIKSNDYLINSLHFHKFRIDIVEIIGDTLNLSGSIVSNCQDKYIDVKIVKEYLNNKKEEYIGKFMEYPTTNRAKKVFLGIEWEFPYNFDFKIPINYHEYSKLYLKLVYHENDNIIEMKNNILFREFAGLSIFGNYLIKNDKILYFRNKTFYIVPYNYRKMLKLEFKSLVRIIRAHESFLFQALFYRLVYLFLFPFWRNKKIWLFIDRDTFADDNAEHLFKYCVKQDDGIKKYFILNKNSPDYKRLNKKYNIVSFGSFKHKINYLFSDKILISQVTRGILNPFTHENSYNYEGLSTYKFCFLQHGVTKDDISWWIKKYHKNLFMFLTVSDLERNSMINGHYNYEENRIPVLGFPRYDNLENNPQNEILFIPTWRRNLDTPEEIINSDYLKNLNSFLNNKKLNDVIKKKGYTLVFRPHPELWKFLDFFNLDHVRLSEEPYQEMFKKASVMITDYSSVAFDFAYLKKPVIYYQDGNYHYGEGYYDYETMGFGDVIYDEEELVNKIISYLDDDCRMEEKYKKRVDSFFKYNDKNNCKRVYDWLLKH